LREFLFVSFVETFVELYGKDFGLFKVEVEVEDDGDKGDFGVDY
jgi:hypothetical protein